MEKRPVVREELVVRKTQVQGEQVVEADLRRERAEVHESGEVRHGGDSPLRGGRDLDGDGVR
jgi:stress response protein YsnF